MVEDEGVPGGRKMGVRDRSGDVLVWTTEYTGTGEAPGGGVDGGRDGEIPFGGDGDDGSGICAGDTCSGCGLSLTSDSGSGARFGSDTGEATIGP